MQTEQAVDDDGSEVISATNDEADAAIVEGNTDDDEVIVSIGDPPAPKTEEQDDDEAQTPKAAAAWAKMRKEKGDAEKKLAQLQRQIDQQKPSQAALALAKEPTLEDDDVDYDQSKFRAKAIAWAKQKAEFDAVSAQATKAATDKHALYVSSIGKMKVGGESVSPKEAHELVTGSFSVDQQNALLQHTDQTHLVVLALGNSPNEVARLAGITDPTKFAVAIARLEEKIKVTSRKPSTSPEKSPTGGRTGAIADKKLDQLEAEADRSGDRSKVVDYKRKLRDTPRK